MAGFLQHQTQQAYHTGSDFGGYQFTSLYDLINAFLVIYVGEDKLIDKASRVDVQFHARRALQELSFDTLKSVKSQEIELPASLTMVLPQDYVNYVKLSWCDSGGIEHVLYPARKTSNPFAVKQDADGVYQFTGNGAIEEQDPTDHVSDTWSKFKSIPTNLTNTYHDQDADSDLFDQARGRRYGLDPQFSQVNGSFYIDELQGKIHFSSFLAGKTITLKYISDSMGTDLEMKVHKFAEEAMYKHISYGILSAKANVPEYIIARLKKERFATTRKAKLRLSNIKLEEITQVFRGKSKIIKH
jgi:hypothetical protein